MDAINSTEPITTGRSIIFKASTISFPIPFQPKIYSTKTAPANIDANQPEIAVTKGFSAFRNACLKSTLNLLNPFAVAVLIYCIESTSKKEFLQSCIITDNGRIAKVITGKTKLLNFKNEPLP